MTARERLDQIEQRRTEALDGFSHFGEPGDPDDTLIVEDTPWLVDLARRLLAVEEAARDVAIFATEVGWARLTAALADLDEWRKTQ